MDVFRTGRERPEDSGAPEGLLQCLLPFTIGVVSVSPGLNSYLTMIAIPPLLSICSAPLGICYLGTRFLTFNAGKSFLFCLGFMMSSLPSISWTLSWASILPRLLFGLRGVLPLYFGLAYEGHVRWGGLAWAQTLVLP